MARARLKRLFPIALSTDAAAEALQIPRHVVHDAIYVTAELRAYEAGQRKRILVKDLIAWVEQTWPRGRPPFSLGYGRPRKPGERGDADLAFSQCGSRANRPCVKR
jgi:hypothetical protein